MKQHTRIERHSDTVEAGKRSIRFDMPTGTPFAPFFVQQQDNDGEIDRDDTDESLNGRGRLRSTTTTNIISA